MAQEPMRRDSDMVVTPGEFAFVQDTTKGLINTLVGAYKTGSSGTDQPVTWDSKTRRFRPCTFEEAIQAYIDAPEGYYVVLSNPAETRADKRDEHPREGTSNPMVALNAGRRVNIPGPAHFPLWPRQTAKVIEGHHLRSNQYLVVRVYNDEEARANWGQAVIKLQTQSVSESGGKLSETTTVTPLTGASATPLPPNITMGQLMVIQGTSVAFYIPPTGVEVIPEQTPNGEVYVREAVTLERIEYCILLDEDGNRRYMQGPDVVFPKPTETFVTKDGNRKFRAIELNENSGIYIKVIAEYTEGEKTHKVGDELFITGKEQAIYFPREEHNSIKYGDQMIHYAVAVPSGEGRYVLDRNKGEVRLVKGSLMLLPDPRKEVVVRRILDAKTVKLWYPGNQQALQVNEELAMWSKQLTPGEYLETDVMRRGIAATSRSKGPEDSVMVDTFRRGTSFTPPRTVTLNTKYEGVPSIDVWTGYAVLVVNKTGARRVVEGPETILLEYDETLMPMELSTGTPKVDSTLFDTVFLRVKNNKVSDMVRVETQDLVQVDIMLSYRVNFEGDKPEQWFSVENYVRFLVDHSRSLIRNTAKHHGIEQFYARAIDIVRDAVLGKQDENGKRPGRPFAENGMRVYDVEVLDVKIGNPEVAKLLMTAQIEALQAALRISKEERDLEFTRRLEEIKRGRAEAAAETEKKTEEIALAGITLKLETNLVRLDAEAQSQVKRLKNQVDELETLNDLNLAQINRQQAVDNQKLEATKAEIALGLEYMRAQTEDIVKRAGAVDQNLAAALTTFSDNALVEKISTSLAPLAAMSGVSAADILSQLFKSTPLEGVMKQLATRTRVPIEAAKQ